MGSGMGSIIVKGLDQALIEDSQRPIEIENAETWDEVTLSLIQGSTIIETIPSERR